MSYHYMCYAPYFPDAAPRRESARDAHHVTVKARLQSGVMTMGSGLLDEEGNVVGNCLIVMADNVEGAKALIQADPYYINRVWDPSKMQITRWRQADLTKM